MDISLFATPARKTVLAFCGRAVRARPLTAAHLGRAAARLAA